MKYGMTGGSIVTPEFIIQGASITVENGKIVKIGQADPEADFQVRLDTSDLVFPALINAHDHMLGTYYPRVGTGPYINWLPWDNDLKAHPLYQERSLIANGDLYLLSAYRNLISGVTTVSDHIPHVVNEGFIDQMPVRVVRNYTLEHECSSYDLKWGRGITAEHAQAVQTNAPFITHLEEGYDEEALLGVDILEHLKALDEHTVLIHGISLSESDIETIAARKANVVWCPSSNYYMFKETTNIRKLLESGVNVSLGTDSPMSGGLNILEEMRFAFSLYREMYHDEMDPKTLVRMVTVNAAKALRLPDLGRIEIGCAADLLVIRNGDARDPYRSLVNAWFDSVKLVTRDGVPLYGSGDLLDIARKFKVHYQLIRVGNRDSILAGQPKDLYERIWNNVKFKKILPFFPVDFI